MRARGTAIGVAALLLATLTGCGDEGNGGDATPEASPSHARLRAAGVQPHGTTRFRCRVESAHGTVTMALDLPRGFTPGNRSEYTSPGPGGFCVWQHNVMARDESGPYQETVVVTLTGRNPATGLQKDYDHEKGDLVEHGESQTDDSVLALRLRHGVPTYGGIAGERLDDWCFCDGQNTIDRSVLADGIRLGYGSVHSLSAQADRELDAVLATAGTLGTASPSPTTSTLAPRPAALPVAGPRPPGTRRHACTVGSTDLAVDLPSRLHPGRTASGSRGDGCTSTGPGGESVQVDRGFATNRGSMGRVDAAAP